MGEGITAHRSVKSKSRTGVSTGRGVCSVHGQLGFNPQHPEPTSNDEQKSSELHQVNPKKQVDRAQLQTSSAFVA